MTHETMTAAERATGLREPILCPRCGHPAPYVSRDGEIRCWCDIPDDDAAGAYGG